LNIVAALVRGDAVSLSDPRPPGMGSGDIGCD